MSSIRALKWGTVKLINRAGWQLSREPETGRLSLAARLRPGDPRFPKLETAFRDVLRRV